MANLETTQDLVNYVLSKMREKTDNTSSFESEVLTQLNQSYRAIVAGGQGLESEIGKPVIFPWAKAQNPKVVNLQPAITTGTVEVTNASTTITFSSAPASSVAGYYFKVDGEGEVYRVATHTGGVATATLDANYVGDTSSSSTYKLLKLDYTFSSDVLVPIAPITAYSSSGPHQISIVPKSTMNRDFPLSELQQNIPTRAAVVKQSEGTFVLQFNAYPQELERVEMEYIAVPTALDTTSENPIMPIHQRVVIAHYAIAQMLQGIDDDRVAYYFNLAKAGFNAMVKEAQGIYSSGSKDYARVIPRMDQYDMQERLLKTEDGFIIDLGNYW